MKNTCCCCRGILLKHLDRDRIYWYCPTCRQEMPNIERAISLSIFNKHREQAAVSLPLVNQSVPTGLE